MPESREKEDYRRAIAQAQDQLKYILRRRFNDQHVKAMLSFIEATYEVVRKEDRERKTKK